MKSRYIQALLGVALVTGAVTLSAVVTQSPDTDPAGKLKVPEYQDMGKGVYDNGIRAINDLSVVANRAKRHANSTMDDDGNFTMPYEFNYNADFRTPEQGWTTPKDGSAWRFEGGWGLDLAGNDDWLYSPGLKLEVGKLYTIHFQFRAYSSTDRNNMNHQIKIGKGRTPEEQTYLLADNPCEGWSSSSIDSRDFYFAPQETGVYYIGDWAIKDTGYHQCIQIVTVDAGRSAAVPGNAENIAANFDNDSLEGTITFDAPAKRLDTQAGTGELTWHLTRAGAEIATGKCQYGTKNISVAETLPQPGAYKYGVTFTSAEGSGIETAYVSRWLGWTYPVLDNPVTATFNDSETAVTLTWPKVTTNHAAAQNGYCDYDAIKYEIKHVSTGEVVGTTTDCTYTRNIGQSDGTFEDHTYEVSAIYHNTDNNATNTKRSNSLVRGAYSLPYSTIPGTSNNGNLGWKILKAEGTNLEWSFYGNYARVYTNQAGNTYLCTPLMNIRPGVKVHISGTMHGSNGATTAVVLKYGDAASIDALTEAIDTLKVTSGNKEDFDTTLVIPGGNKVFAFHYESTARPYKYFYLDRFALEYVPDDVTDDTTALNVPVNFSFPTQASFDKWTEVNFDGNTGTHWDWVTFDGNPSPGIRYQCFITTYDDWLFSPKVYLAKGKPYKFGYMTRERLTGGRYTYMEMAVSRDTTVESVIETVSPFTKTLEDGSWLNMPEGYFVPEESGFYHVGIHIKDLDGGRKGWQSIVDNVTVSYLPMEKNPGKAVDAKFEASGWSGVLSFKAPTTTIDGSTLESLRSVEIKRNGAQYMKLFNIAPGQQFSFTENALVSGNYSYEITFANEEGNSFATTVGGFMGFDAPVAVTGTKVYEKADEPGKLFVEWQPSTKDIHGTDARDGDVTYNIVDAGGVALATGLTECNGFVAVPTDTAAIMQVGVQAVSSMGASSYELSDLLSVGKAYSTPYLEGFAGGQITKVLAKGNPLFAVQALASGWGGIPACDDDGGFLINQRQAVDDGFIQFGKIKVGEDLVTPVLSFFVNNIKADNINIVGVQVNDGNGWTTLKEGLITGESFGPDMSWGKVICDLAPYKGKEIAVRITYGIRKYVNIAIDHIEVANCLNNDLKAVGVSIAPKAEINKNTPITVTIANHGLKSIAAKKYKVVLYRDGEVVGGSGGATLKSGAANAFTFNNKFTVFDEGTHKYWAEAQMADDENQANNISDTVVMEVAGAVNPEVTLKGNLDEQGVVAQLSWELPNIDPDAPYDYNESFEKVDQFSVAIDGWTFIDRDKKPVGGFNGITIPGWTAGTSLGSFMVWGADVVPKLAGVGQAKDGNQVLASIFNAGTNDDWAISPELTGNAQTISFSAIGSTYGDKYRVLYSTGSLEPDSFVTVIDTTTLANAWTDVTFDVPAGAKYFALHYCSTDAFFILFDNFKFVGKNPLANLQLKNYKVWRNGKLLASPAAGTTTYNDGNACEINDYNVTALYKNGEGKLSNTITLSMYPPVTTLNGTIENDRVNLTWEAPKFQNGNEMPVENYDVYRDGAKLNGQPITATEYADANMTLDKAHTYTVVAHYATGDSKPSNEFVATVSGIEDALSTTAVEVARYDELGREVDVEAQGWVIIRYSDGTSAKKLMK